MNKQGIYGHANAGKIAFKLFEELSVLTNTSGWVDLRKTISSKVMTTKDYTKMYVEPSDIRAYPPVYEVWWVPNSMTHISQERMNKLFELGEKYACNVDTRVHENRLVVKFTH